MPTRNKIVVANHGFKCGNVFYPIRGMVGCSMFTNLNQIDKDTILILEGGTDVDPTIYKETRGTYTGWPDKGRDHLEKMLFERVLSVGAAAIGICRGAQFVTAMLGGKLFQHVTGHGMNHHIFLPDIQEIPKQFRDTEITITSTHHQMMDLSPLPADNYKILGGVHSGLSSCYFGSRDVTEYMPEIEPEIVLFPKHHVLAIQGHPEYMLPSDNFPLLCRELVQKHLMPY